MYGIIVCIFAGHTIWYWITNLRLFPREDYAPHVSFISCLALLRISNTLLKNFQN